MKLMTYALCACLTVATFYSSAPCATMADTVVSFDLSSFNITLESPTNAEVQYGLGSFYDSEDLQFLNSGRYQMFDSSTDGIVSDYVELPDQINTTHATMEFIGSPGIWPQRGDDPIISSHSNALIPDGATFSTYLEASTDTYVGFYIWGSPEIYEAPINATFTIDYHISAMAGWDMNADGSYASTAANIETRLWADDPFEPVSELILESYEQGFELFTTESEYSYTASNDWSGQLLLSAVINPIYDYQWFSFELVGTSIAQAGQYVRPPEPSPVPEPSTFLLLGAGLAGLVWFSRKRR